MDHRDALISNITVVVDSSLADHDMKAAVDRLKSMGMEIDSVDEDNGVVEGVIEAAKVRGIEKMEGIDYVRTQYSYIADYPPGDPRDRDTQPA